MKYKEVKYKVLDLFGQVEAGTIINTILLAKDPDSNRGLLYHPHVKGECPSFEIGYEGAGGVWMQSDAELYVNIPSRYRKFESDLLGPDFSFNRVVYDKEEID